MRGAVVVLLTAACSAIVACGSERKGAVEWQGHAFQEVRSLADVPPTAPRHSGRLFGNWREGNSMRASSGSSRDAGSDMSVTIREYQDRDLGECRGLWRDLTQRHRDIYSNASIGGDDPGVHFEHHLSNANLAGVWVAEEGSVVVGMAGLLMNGKEAEIEPVVVRAGFRSRGVGTQLIEMLKTEAKARGARYLTIRPVARNIEAITCFYRAGFTLLGQIDMFLELDGDEGREWTSGITIHGCPLRF